VNTAYKPSAAEIKELREESGAGMSDVRNALIWAEGDMAKAKARLGELGQAKADKKAERSANEGLVGSYIHAGGKIGVLVEVNCETDFVARNERFKELVRDIAMHVAAMSPKYLDRSAVAENELAEVKAELKKTVPAGKPPEVVEKILTGKLNKWYEEHTLLEQPFVKDDAQTVGELVKSVSGVLGEKIEVRRYVKFALGEE
jgi:elongation factor Ts